MGYEAPCTIRFDGKSAKGTAWLEHKELVFRGPIRMAIPLGEVREAHAENGTLHVRFGATRAELDVGAVAARWADRISNPPSRLDKLGVKPGMTVVVLGMQEHSFLHEIERRGAIVSRRTPDGQADVVFWAANGREDLGALPSLVAIIKPQGAIWIVRPKGQKAVTEAETMAAGKRAGLVDVKVVSFSDTHTAEKFVIPVKDRPRPPAISRNARVKSEVRRAAPGRSASPSPGRRGSASSRGRT